MGRPCLSRWRRSAGPISAGSTPTTNRSWQRAQARGGMALTGVAGVPHSKASTSKLHQPNTFSAARQSRLAPPGFDGRAIGPPSGLAIREYAAHAVGDFSRHELMDANLAVRADDGRDGVREQNSRVGKQPAPIAGMMAALARVDGEVERQLAARAEEHGRLSAQSRGPSDAISRSARNSSRSASTVAQAGQPASSPISISHLALKPSLPRCLSTAAMAARLMACWPLLSATPRPYQRLPLGHRPGLQPGFQSRPARAPRRRGRSPAPWAGTISIRSAKRKGPGAAGCVEHAASEAHGLERGHHFGIDVPAKIGHARRVAAVSRYGHPAGKVGLESAGIEMAGGGVDGGFAGHREFLLD